jgi:hypothetical protein
VWRPRTLPFFVAPSTPANHTTQGVAVNNEFQITFFNNNPRTNSWYYNFLSIDTAIFNYITVVRPTPPNTHLAMLSSPVAYRYTTHHLKLPMIGAATL